MANRPKQSARDENTAKSVVENVKETLESIVVAFILAFVFRAFLMEAFVIPTGSMAATLYGDHATTTCSTCGCEYARGINTEDVQQACQVPGYTIGLRCPNCDAMIDQAPTGRIRRPDSGDRILVWKWAYDLGLKRLAPNRWDVVVFKNPTDGTLNFIKRLIGLPGEVLEIIEGDIYAAPLAQIQKDDPELIEEMEALRLRVASLQDDQTALPPTGISETYERINARLLPFLKIQRKTELAQESLWINVYDNDLHPATPAADRPATPVGWWAIDAEAGQAWVTSGRELQFVSESQSPRSIVFAGKPITDFVAYNYVNRVSRPEIEGDLVGDVRLRFVWFIDAGSGGISLSMNRDRDTFVASLAADGVITLEHLRADLPGGRRVVGQSRLSEPPQAGQGIPVEFSILDYRATVKVDGQEMVATRDGDGHYTPDLKHALKVNLDPNYEPEPTRVQISAHHLRCRLRHVALDRDVYYRSALHPEERVRHTPDGPIIRNPYYRWPGWGTAGRPIMLRPDRIKDGRHYDAEYFMLGDNSPASKDSRLWWEIGPHLTHLGQEYQVGTVPADQLIGKAFFVYWPAGYRPAWGGGIGLIPNFGQMRWIR